MTRGGVLALVNPVGWMRTRSAGLVGWTNCLASTQTTRARHMLTPRRSNHQPVERCLQLCLRLNCVALGIDAGNLCK